MRLEAVRLRHMGPFDEYELDLDELGDARIVAVTGGNGAGKSTLLELGIPGALYRSTPTRGSLADLATARDALVESRLNNGRGTYTVRHLVDGVSRNGETVVLNGDGRPVYKSTKVSAFDAWVKQHFPAEEELCVSTFCPQAQAGFIGLTDGERKSVLLRVLGISRYEALAERARKRAAALRNELATLDARLADEHARGIDVAQAEAELTAARTAAAAADAALEQAQADLEAARALAQSAERLRAEYREARERRATLRQQLEQATAKQVDLETRIANNRTVQARAEEIRAAISDLDRLKAEVAPLEVQIAGLRAEISRCDREHKDLQAKRAAATARADRAAARLTERDRVAAAVADLSSCEVAEAKAAQEVSDRRAELDRIRRQHVAGFGERVEALRAGLEEIRLADAEIAHEIAADTLERDDAVIVVARELPTQMAAADEALAKAIEQHTQWQKSVTDCHQLAARQSELAAAEHDHAEATREVADIDAQADAVVTRHAAATSNLESLIEEQRATAQAIAAAEPLAKQADALARAEARLAELEPQAATCLREVGALNIAIDDVPEPPADPEIAPVDAQGAVRAGTRTRDAHAAVAVAERGVGEAVARRGRLVTLTTEKTGVEADLADWTRLGADLGKDGLQALEIDAAGPELTAMVNDLLHTCVGPRFSVLINTQPLSTDGKRVLEGCEVLVTDTVGGREAEASTFSGGERVIIGEAISLALTMFGCRRTGAERPTLVRDETGAALDPENARAYVGMLRRAADFVGADRVLFVTHDRAVQELADARVQVQAV